MEEHWLAEVEELRHEARVIQRPEVGRAVGFHAEVEDAVGDESGRVWWEGVRDALVEECDLFVYWEAGNVNVRLRLGIVTLAIDREKRMASNDLRGTIRTEPNLVITRPVRLDQDTIPIAVGDGNRLDLLRLNVRAVHGVHPHVVLVDGDDAADKVDAADDVNRRPLLRRARRLECLDDFDGSVGVFAAGEGSGKESAFVALAAADGDED